jgi:hypothetical protein
MLGTAKLLTCAVLALLVSVASPRAQAPDRLAAAMEMMEVAGVARQFDEVMPVLAEHLSQSFVALAPDKAETIREVFSQLSSKFVARKAELIEQIAGLYAEQLTAEELGAIISFYKSPAGARFIAIQPRVVRQSMVVGQRWGSQIGQELEAEARKELKKRGIDL